ncbi:MAG: ComF family protein [Acetobacteraceae bacterium]
MAPLPSGFERALRGAGRLALDLLLPPHCLTCDQPVTEPGQICPACFARTSFITPPCCERCGVPFEAADQGGLVGQCMECRADPPPWSAARAALRYDDQTKRIILPFKYGDRVETAGALAPLMARAGAALLRDADWLVPVPLHRRRLIARRYNQAALLARALSRLAGRPALLDALQRTRSTRPLAVMSPAARAKELEGAIQVRPGRVAALADARVLLIDDVLTSGATARACAGALLRAGAARVDVLAAARVRNQQFDN